MVATMGLQLFQSEIALQARALAHAVAVTCAALGDRDEQYPWGFRKALAEAAAE
jgi:hypothetical protein